MINITLPGELLLLHRHIPHRFSRQFFTNLRNHSLTSPDPQCLTFNHTWSVHTGSRSYLTPSSRQSVDHTRSLFLHTPQPLLDFPHSTAHFLTSSLSFKLESYPHFFPMVRTIPIFKLLSIFHSLPRHIDAPQIPLRLRFLIISDHPQIFHQLFRFFHLLPTTDRP